MIETKFDIEEQIKNVARTMIEANDSKLQLSIQIDLSREVVKADYENVFKAEIQPLLYLTNRIAEEYYRIQYSLK